MRCQAFFFDIDERLKDLPVKGDDLDRLKGLIDFRDVDVLEKTYTAGNGS